MVNYEDDFEITWDDSFYRKEDEITKVAPNNYPSVVSIADAFAYANDNANIPKDLFHYENKRSYS